MLHLNKNITHLSLNYCQKLALTLFDRIEEFVATLKLFCYKSTIKVAKRLPCQGIYKLFGRDD